MAELDERIQWLHERLTCPWPYQGTPPPDWVMETMRELIARDGERGEALQEADRRLRGAAEAADIVWAGCDTPDHLAQALLVTREHMMRLEKENAELREQIEDMAMKATDADHRQAICQQDRETTLRQKVKELERQNQQRGALVNSLRTDIQRLWHEHKSVVAYKGCTCPECSEVRETLERAPRLQERLDRLEGRLRGRFHDDMACGACGGPLDACRDAICCQCSPEPEVLAAMARLRRAEGILAERDRQDAKWGADQGKTPWEWLAVIVEEVGELAQVLLRRKFGGDEVPEEWWEEAWRLEATQVAASALAMIEQTQGKGASDEGD